MKVREYRYLLHISYNHHHVLFSHWSNSLRQRSSVFSFLSSRNFFFSLGNKYDRSGAMEEFLMAKQNWQRVYLTSSLVLLVTNTAWPMGQGLPLSSWWWIMSRSRFFGAQSGPPYEICQILSIKPPQILSIKSLRSSQVTVVLYQDIPVLSMKPLRQTDAS